jgi:hypothetical protein
LLYFIRFVRRWMDGWMDGGQYEPAFARVQQTLYPVHGLGEELSPYIHAAWQQLPVQSIHAARQKREREHTVRRTGKPNHRKRPTSRQIRRRKIQRPRRLWYGGLPRANPLLDTFRIYTSVFLLTLGLHARTSVAKRDSLGEKPYSAMDPRAFGGRVFRLPQAV